MIHEPVKVFACGNTRECMTDHGLLRIVNSEPRRERPWFNKLRQHVYVASDCNVFAKLASKRRDKPCHELWVLATTAAHDNFGQRV